MKRSSKIQINVGNDLSLDSVLETLTPAGVRREQLISVSAGPGPGTVVPTLPPTPGPAVGYRYVFFLRVAPAAIPDLIARLNELQQSGRFPPGSVVASGALSAASSGAVANGRAAALPGLFADARRRDAMWRQAAGLTASAPVVFLTGNQTQTGRLVGGGFPFPFAAEPLGTTINYSLGMHTGEGPLTLGVTASQTVILAPERITVRVALNTEADVTTAAVLEHLGEAGFVESDVESVDARITTIGPVPGGGTAPGGPGGIPAPRPGLVYQIISTQPAENADSILRILARLQRTPPRCERRIHCRAA
jgi:hypothetical protein